MSATHSVDAPQTKTNSLRRLGSALFIGTTLEWYDYFVYGAAAALALNKLFFPSYDPAVGTILAFGTFASAWLTRPLGAFIFGHLGDIIGRQKVLYITLVGMGIATIGTGLLPTYNAIGVWAPLLLILFRMIQGLSAGGEFSGVATMSIEHAPEHLRGRYSSLAQMGIPAALILANLISLFAYHMPNDALYAYGWRIPFLVSGLIFPVAIYIRRKLHESPAFVQAKEADTLVKNPVFDVIRGHWRTILALMFANGAMGVSFYAYGTFAVSYATTEIGLSRTLALLSVVIAGCVHITCVAIFGWFSDSIGRMKIFIVALALLAVAPFPVFALIDTGSSALYILAVAVALGIGHGSAWSVAAVFFTEFFPPELRYSGSAISYQVSAAVLVGPVTIVSGILVAAAGGAPWLAAGFLSLICITGVIGAITLRGAARKSNELAQHQQVPSEAPAPASR